jgi:isoamylase
MVEIWPGLPDPPGATYDGEGTQFSIYSGVADRVTLCLFDPNGEETRIDLPERTAFYWHGYVPGVRPGQRYGFRVHGPWDPAAGLRCRPEKLLLDPYARATDGAVHWVPALFDHDLDDPEGLRPNTEDSAPHTFKSVVINPYFDWGDDAPPKVPPADTILYETHVKGFTARMDRIPRELRGTYAGLAHPAAIEHFTRLGVTAVELLPIQQFCNEPRLVRMGLANYWGYNSIGFFAPHAGYAAAESPRRRVQEFKGMVRRLHSAGLEVILDVVYNHTAESDRHGPVLSFRGLDNAAYYRLDPNDRRRYVNYTGTGNTIDARHPAVLRLIMDSLRYWVTEMHVDGFRFDLAPVLGRESDGYDPGAGFLDALRQDPILRRVKLIAEAWDVGPGGYQVGGFPHPWSEWNDRYRDGVRDFWRPNAPKRSLGELATRLTGSADLFQGADRPPQASVNLITSHDGYTLHDLVTYEKKHNAANGEENRDGHNDNRSWNGGVEGETDDPEIQSIRCQRKRSFLATLFLSQGVPMLLAGDEMGRTQRGNNNAYCQDGELTWLDWEGADTALIEFTRRLIALRQAHPVFRRRRWLRGHDPSEGEGASPPDVIWYRPDGREMTEADWRDPAGWSLMVCLSGRLGYLDADGHPMVDDDFCLLLNAGETSESFTLPSCREGASWQPVIDTTRWAVPADASPHPGGEAVTVAAHALVLLQLES